MKGNRQANEESLRKGFLNRTQNKFGNINSKNSHSLGRHDFKRGKGKTEVEICDDMSDKGRVGTLCEELPKI